MLILYGKCSECNKDIKMAGLPINKNEEELYRKNEKLMQFLATWAVPTMEKLQEENERLKREIKEYEIQMWEKINPF